MTHPRAIPLRIYTGLAAGLWTVVVLGSWAWTLRQQTLHILDTAEEEARESVDVELAFFDWFNGQDIKTPSDPGVSMVGHAYALKELSRIRTPKGMAVTRLISLAPKNPADAPDEWERASLERIVRGDKEALSKDDGVSLRYMRPLRLEAACLKCHGREGSRLGDIRGGISCAVPLAPKAAAGRAQRGQFAASHFLVWGMGVIGLAFGHRRLRRALRELQDSEERARLLFDSSRDALMTLEPPSWRFTSGNAATLAMFLAKDEAEFTSHGPWELSPEKQPDGRASAGKAREMIETAMREGSHLFTWIHKRLDGTDFPAEVLLTRVQWKGKVLLQATVRDVTERKKVEAEREAALRTLQEALAQVKLLSGFIPICASCKKVRNDKGYWESVEAYVHAHSEAQFSHGICPDCGKNLYGKFYKEEPHSAKG